MGWVGQAAGARWSLVIGGLPTLVCGILALPALSRIDRRLARNPAPAPPGSTEFSEDHAPAISSGRPAGVRSISERAAQSF